MSVSETVCNRPLCVDLDGSVVRTDLLFESFLLLLKRNPAYVFLAVLWLLRGRAVLKAEIARRVHLDLATLPYDAELLTWLRSERARGRRIWLCTGANEDLASAVAAHLGIFDGVIASDARSNLVGRAKAQRLVQSFGHRNFDYCGNEWRDLAIWGRSGGAIVVGSGRALALQVAAQAQVLQTFSRAPGRARAIVRALRPHQWAKNALLFVPLLAAHRANDLNAVAQTALAFVAFCLTASSVYVLNDLLDLQADRAHVRKCRRPFASGELSVATGLGLAPVLLAAGAILASFLTPEFRLTLAGYYTVTMAYSLGLKGMMLIDALSLAGLYTLRVIAGAAAAQVPLSFWLLLFSVFLFLSLALVKRYAELDSLRRRGQLQAAGRGYQVEDLPLLETLGISAGYLSVLVLALYINSPATVPLYRHPEAIWPLCVIMLYWITRIWMKTHRGKMHDDPVVFALQDRVSMATGLLAALTVSLAV